MQPLLALAHDHFAYRGGGEIMLLRAAAMARESARLCLELLWARDRGVLGESDAKLFEAIEYLDLPAKLHWKTLSVQRAKLQALEQRLAKEQARGILAFSLRSAIRMAPMARRIGAAMAWMCQQSFPLFLPPLAGVKEFAGLRALRSARTRIICISDEARLAFIGLGFPEAHIHLIRNGIDYDRYSTAAIEPDTRAARLRELGLGSMDMVVVCVARLDPIKNHLVLLQALADARKKGRQIGAIFVGGRAPHAPEHEDFLRKEAEQLGVAGQVIWAGECADIRPWLALADAAVLPSLKEAAGLVLAEAGAAGLPLLGARVGGIPELVRNGETGFLFPPDDPSTLANELIMLAENVDQRSEIGAAARRKVSEEFNAKRQDQLWRTFLSQFLAADKSRASSKSPP